MSLVLDMSALGAVEPLTSGVVTPRERASQEYLLSAGRALPRQRLQDVVLHTQTLHAEFAVSHSPSVPTATTPDTTANRATLNLKTRVSPTPFRTFDCVLYTLVCVCVVSLFSCHCHDDLPDPTVVSVFVCVCVSFCLKEIPMNFVDPKELDIPSHGTKNQIGRASCRERV